MYEELTELVELQTKLIKQHYFDHVLFSYQWWFLVCICVLLWGIWAILVDKKRIHIILLVGLITSIVAILLDDIGLSQSLWEYPYQIVYFTTRMDPIDMSVIPVFYMLLYQYMRTWKWYIITLIL
jgi:hypothetical protein